jgi:ribosomal-protein-serine acetyltransferase
VAGEPQFPEVVDGERVALRKYTVHSADDLFRLVEENRTILIENFAALTKEVQSIDAAKSLIARKDEEWDKRTGFCYGVYVRASNALIGQLQVKNLVWDIPSAELSYFVDRSYQRQGLVGEAITAMVATMFEALQFNRVFVRIIPKNVASIGLANKLGFKPEGLQRAAFRCGHGELHDVHYFALTSADYNHGLAPG